MKRDRAYYRKMREKHIKRKKRIGRCCYFNEWYYPYDGMFSKNKVHSSSGINTRKTRNKKYKRRHIKGNYASNINYKHSDLLKIQSMEDEAKDFLEGDSLESKNE